MTLLVRSTLAGLVLIITVSAVGATVNGTVTTATGALSGAVVSAYDATGVLRGNAATDGAGRYVLMLPGGSYRLLAYDPAGAHATVFHPNADSFETSALVPLAEAAAIEVSFTLPRAGVLSGMVSGGSALLTSGVVEVYNLSGTRRAATTTNASGAYSLVLPAGEYKVFAYDANDVFGGVFSSNAIAFADAPLVRITPPEATTVSFALSLAGHLTGVVVDAETRAPLAQKLVYVYTPAGALVTSRATDAAGAVRIPLAASSYRLVAADPAGVYAPVYYIGSRSFEGSDVVTLASGEERSDLTLAAVRAGVVRGSVSASVKTTVLALNLDGTRHASAETTAGGGYALVVAAGAYKLAVIDPAGHYATQFYPASQFFASAESVSVLSGQTLTGMDFSPIRGGQIAGTVRDGANDQPLSGMTVLAYDLIGQQVAQVSSGATGAYRLVVMPGQYRLLVVDSRFEYATAYAAGATSYETTRPLTIEADTGQSASFVMFRGVRVTGKVVEEHGTPLGGVEVFALDASRNRVAGATTTSAGTFTLVVQPGLYTLVTRDPFHRYVMRTSGTPVAAGLTSPPPVTLTMGTITRRRTVRS